MVCSSAGANTENRPELQEIYDRCYRENPIDEGEQMGANLTFSGEVKGTDTWYFAYKEGLFVKMTSSGSTEGTVNVSGIQSMTIPMTVEIKNKTRLIK